MKGALRIGSAAAVALTVSAGPARADDGGKFEVGGFGGWHHFNENNELGARDVDEAFSVDPSPAFGLRVGYWILPMLGLELEGLVMPSEDRRGASEEVVVGYRVNALYQMPMGKVKPFILVGAGGMSNSSEKEEVLLDDTDFVAHAGLGARFDIGETWGARVDGRWLFPPSSASEGVTSDFELLLGLYKTFGGAEVMEHVEVIEEEPAPTDEDGDGIVGEADQCPTEPEDMDQFEDDNGCPDPDNDGDGIADGSDKCPMEAETVNNIDDGDGCPEKDEDGDGIIGSADQCPTEAEDKDGFEDENGCPDPDNDGDGVLDADDKCPAEAETMNGFQDSDGCKDDVPKAIQKFTGVIKGINFKTNSPDLTKGSFRTLDRAMKVLVDYPDVRMEIQGHTDDVVNPKDPDFNRTLSQKRAETVKEYFVSKGIAADRLEAKGYGPDKPIDPRKTAAARAKNRRVEFQLITGQTPAPQTTPTKDPTNPGTPPPQPQPPPATP
ncbi:MAG TPA: OmpA family protein [Kofleriaceae bacterium]|nr:OmpA family protein [Kofleriaceae bacterium]